MNHTVLIAAVTAGLLAGCASQPEPTFGDQIRASGVGNLAGDWEKAQADVRKAKDLREEGEARVERGERLIREAKRDIERGENMIERGKREAAQGKREEDAARARRAGIEADFEKAQAAAKPPVE